MTYHGPAVPSDSMPPLECQIAARNAKIPPPLARRRSRLLRPPARRSRRLRLREAALSVPRRLATTPVHPGTRRLCLSLFRRTAEPNEDFPACPPLLLALPPPTA